MKTVIFEGKEYKVEDWVNYIARDEDSYAYKYEVSPYLDSTVHGEWIVDSGNIELLGKSFNIAVDWETSLVKV